MYGLMQGRPLLVSGLIDYAAAFHGTARIVSRDATGALHHSDWARIHRRARRLAAALAGLGVVQGERVATLAWNGHRHLECYFGVIGSGVVLHTVNPRLFLEQIQYIIDHAEDGFVFFEPGFAALVNQLAPLLPRVRGWIAMCAPDAMPDVVVGNLLCYETLLADAADDFVWPVFDENTASTLCYTSGTTGNPKGVLYSHRSTVLHAFAEVAPDCAGISARDTILTVVPLFHANAWGLPFAAAMTGAQMVLPGPMLDPASIFMLLRDEKVTLAAGIPTIWLNFLNWVEANRASLDLAAVRPRLVLAGGTAAPRRVIQLFRELFGADFLHAWGMTETSPIATVGTLLGKHAGIDDDTRYDLQLRQGRSIYGCEVKIVGPEGQDMPRDGASVGEVKVRGPWVISGYFKGAGGQVCDADGWFGTGDVGTIDADGYLQLTDRLKDVIKSGGEWISSIDIENMAVAHPDVHEAAVIAVPHPVWQERPLLIIQPKPGRTPETSEILAFLATRFAKWQLPEQVIFVESLPHTATGKLLKTTLRAQYGGAVAVRG